MAKHIHIWLRGSTRDADGPAHAPAGSSKGGQFVSGSGGGGSAKKVVPGHSASANKSAKEQTKNLVNKATPAMQKEAAERKANGGGSKADVAGFMSRVAKKPESKPSAPAHHAKGSGGGAASSGHKLGKGVISHAGHVITPTGGGKYNVYKPEGTKRVAPSASGVSLEEAKAHATKHEANLKAPAKKGNSSTSGSREDVEKELAVLSKTAQARIAEAHKNKGVGVAISGAEVDHLDSKEKARLHELQQKLREYANEHDRGASARLAAKIAARKAAQNK